METTSYLLRLLSTYPLLLSYCMYSPRLLSFPALEKEKYIPFSDTTLFTQLDKYYIFKTILKIKQFHFKEWYL